VEPVVQVAGRDRARRREIVTPLADPDQDDRRLISGLTLEEIKKIRRVIGVAGGSTKHEPIQAALAGKLVNVLVTDHVTAQHLLRS